MQWHFCTYWIKLNDTLSSRWPANNVLRPFPIIYNSNTISCVGYFLVGYEQRHIPNKKNNEWVIKWITGRIFLAKYTSSCPLQHCLCDKWCCMHSVHCITGHIPGIRWGCWSYMSCTRFQVVSSSEKNICLSSEMLSYDVGIVPVGVLDLGWLETRGVSILKHQCASAPRTSGTCRLFLKADLSLKKKKRQFYFWCMTLLPES